MEHDDIVRSIHDASIALGAQCDSNCAYYGVPNDADLKSWMKELIRSFMFPSG